MTRACSSGALDECGCDRTVQGRSPQGFEWAGCSDNIAYGNAFSRTFVDARERARGTKATRALMNLHNNEAGRQVKNKFKHHNSKYIINFTVKNTVNYTFQRTP